MFIQPGMEGNQDKAVLEFIIRDFTEVGLQEKETYLQNQLNDVMTNYPGSSAQFVVKEQYRNMKDVLDQHPAVVDNALEAIRRVGTYRPSDAAFGVVPMARGYRLWGCLARISLRVNMPFTPGRSGYRCRICKKPLT